MFNRYYKQELTRLSELGQEFANAYPAVAPMLAGSTADPDVERLLEGVAFLTGQLRHKLNDEFPEILHGLLQLIFPHYLRPIPAATIMAFTPRPNLQDPLEIPAGVELASEPVEGTECKFRTCYPVTVHPLTITDARFDVPAVSPPCVRLRMQLDKVMLQDWRVDDLRFHLGGDYAVAADLYHLLHYNLQSIIIKPTGEGESITLPPEALRPAGFGHDESLLPYPPQAFPGYRILQEYLILPEKFLFFDLTGLNAWRRRGEGTEFEIIFQFKDIPGEPPAIKQDSFVLFATPAINLFQLWSDPLQLDHRQAEYLIHPDSTKKGHYQVYSIDEVKGIRQGEVREREYIALERFAWGQPASPTYHTSHRRASIGKLTNVYLSVLYPQDGPPPQPEVLSIEMSCTNAALPERLNLGDICKPTSTSPETVTFRNIRLPTCAVEPPIGGTLLWRLLSHLSINQLPLASSDNLRTLLRLYIFPDSRDRAAVYANRRRVDGIMDVQVSPSDRIVRGHMMRGQEIALQVEGDHFASEGDLYLFGTVLDHFLGGYSAINAFNRLTLKDISGGHNFAWPERVGDRSLL